MAQESRAAVSLVYRLHYSRLIGEVAEDGFEFGTRRARTSPRTERLETTFTYTIQNTPLCTRHLCTIEHSRNLARA